MAAHNVEHDLELHRHDVMQAVKATPTQLYIGGEFRDAASSGRFGVNDPATGDLLATCCDAGEADIEAALADLHQGFREWREVPAQERCAALAKASSMLKQRQHEFAAVMSAEMGKPLKDSLGEVAYAAGFLDWFAGEGIRTDGHFMPNPKGDGHIACVREPVGVCFAVTPWNFPLAMGTRKLAPAIAAGCTMLVKPASSTPLTMLLLAEVFKEAGIPGNVVSVLPTSSSSTMSEKVLKDSRVRKFTFTGSTAVGAKLAEMAAENILRVSLELGGNAPFIVAEDADVDAAVEGAVLAKLRNVGQACTAANRFYVHSSIADDFVNKLVEQFDAKSIGPAFSGEADLGPLISDDQRSTVLELVDDALKHGAELATSTKPGELGSPYVPATVLTGVTDDMRIAKEEIFGPVAAVQTFDDDDEAITRANSTPFGLVSYVYSEGYRRSMRYARGLESGMVGVNTGLVSNPAAPFGGYKSSGYGREGGFEGIEEYTEVKYISMA